MKRFALLFGFGCASVLYGQVPGLVTVQAGALACGAVMRSATEVQTYCYGPGTPLKLVHNALETINQRIIINYEYCAKSATGCPYVIISWDFTITNQGIWWNATVGDGTGSTNVTSGTLTKVYGTP